MATAPLRGLVHWTMKSDKMIGEKVLAAGTRVRLRSPSHVVRLRSDLGRIVRPDEYLGYYVVRLDEPATYFHADGRTEELPEIVEDVDNMDVLPNVPDRVVDSSTS